MNLISFLVVSLYVAILYNLILSYIINNLLIFLFKMSDHVLPILMFCALPASGKSETRRYLKTLTKEDTKKFHLGETSTQVDDFPYVDGMKKIDALRLGNFDLYDQ